MMIPKVSIPNGTSGDWKVEKFEVSEEDAKFESLRAAFSYSSRWIKAGEYTRLTYKGQVIMSDTPAEMRDHWEPVSRAKGNILINGLGLGMVASACLIKSSVNHVTIIEISPDVIALVAPTLEQNYSDKVSIINADALTYKPAKGSRFDMVWHDIWPDICSDNLKDMHFLHRRYGRLCDWQGSWGYSQIKYSLKGRW